MGSVKLNSSGFNLSNVGRHVTAVSGDAHALGVHLVSDSEIVGHSPTFQLSC